MLVDEITLLQVISVLVRKDSILSATEMRECACVERPWLFSPAEGYLKLEHQWVPLDDSCTNSYGSSVCTRTCTTAAITKQDKAKTFIHNVHMSMVGFVFYRDNYAV